MAKNFLDNAPVGTKIFNKEDKRYYVKVNLGDRTIWKEARGSSITTPFRDLTIDKVGRKVTYVDKDGVKHTADTGDDIKDYLQRGKGMIQIKDGKYYDPGDKELTGLKIGERKGKVYTIENFKSKTGIDLQSRLTEGSDYRKYFNKNKKAINLQKEIARFEAIPEKNRRGVPNYDTRLQNLKDDLKKLNLKPYKGTGSDGKPKTKSNIFTSKPNKYDSEVLNKLNISTVEPEKDYSDIKDPNNKEVAITLDKQIEEAKNTLIPTLGGRR